MTRKNSELSHKNGTTEKLALIFYNANIGPRYEDLQNLQFSFCEKVTTKLKDRLYNKNWFIPKSSQK